MHSDPLATYLNHHLAGSVGGIDLVETLAKAAVRANDLGRATWLDELRGDLVSAQRELRAVMERVHAREAVLQQAGGWLAERITRTKLAVTAATDGGPLASLEALEALGLGLQGQAALWRALDVVLPPGDPRRGDTTFAALEARAHTRFAEVDRARLTAAAGIRPS
jgi:hypothetical protein